MRRVLILNETSGPGGAERMLISLASSLDRRRFAPVVCLPKPGWVSKELEARGIELHFLPPKRRALDLRWVAALRRLALETRAGVIHSHEFGMNTYGAILSLLTGLPVVATVHGKNYYAEKWRRRLIYRAVARVARLVAVSADIREFLVRAVGIDPRRLELVYNGIHCGDFAFDAERRRRLRAELGVGEDETLVGAVGNLYPVKGHAFLVRAAPEVLEQAPAARFVVAGRGDQLAGLEALAREAGVASRFRFLGFREDVPDLLQALDIYTMPSLSEGMPLSILEAMAAGRPVIASRVGGIPEAVVEGETGFLFEVGNVAELARRIRELALDPALARRLGEAGRERVRGNFGIDRMVAAYERLYEEVG